MKPKVSSTLKTRSICGAKAKSTGLPCQRSPLAGRTRCRLHGGVTKTKGKVNKDAVKPGALYSRYLTPDERVVFDLIELGSVDSELRLMRVRLERALREEKKQAERDEAEDDITLELESRTERDGGGPFTVDEERTYKRRDWRVLVERLSSKIESLEKTRAELTKAKAPTDNDLAAALSRLADRLPV